MPERSEDEDDRLAPYFAGARAPDAVPDATFLARLETDAVAAAAPRAGVGRAPSGSGVLSVFGGWFGLGGLAAAMIAGVWVGVAPPMGVPDPAGYVFETGEVSGLYEDWSEIAQLEAGRDD